MTGWDSADPEGSRSRGWTVFTQGPRCGGAGSLRGPRRRRTLAAAGESCPEKEDLETEAWRAGGSGPCRDSGRRFSQESKSWGWEELGALQAAPQCTPLGTPPRPLWHSPAWPTCSAPQPVCGGPQRCLPTEARRVCGWQLVASPGDWECRYQRTIRVCHCPLPVLPRRWEGQEKTGG